MSRISYASVTTPLSLSSTIEEPRNDPGLKLRLKRKYSGRECFDKFHPYLLWLRSFINKNKWVNGAVVKQFQDLWNLYTRAESEYAKITALSEFFSQKAHSEVEKLWQMYRDLRRDIEDLATQRVTMRAAEAADEGAQAALSQGRWTTEAAATKNLDSPESSDGDPFLNPEDM